MRDARRAGRYPAISATIVSTTSIARNVAGSRGVTPKSSQPALCDQRPGRGGAKHHADGGEPQRLQDDAPCTSRADAPSAMRMPISCVR